MDDAPDLTAALAAVRAVALRVHTASGDELLADAERIERIGRVVDGWRITAAAQIDRLSRKALGEQSLSFSHGARDAIDLLMATTQIGCTEAKRRIGLGCALAPRVGMEVILRSAQAADEATPLEVLHRAVEALDPDGDEPDELVRRRQRALRFGKTFLDGTTQLTGRVLPEDLAVLKEFLQSRLRTATIMRTEAGSDETDDSLGSERRPEEPSGDPERHDPKCKAQQDYDTLVDAIRIAARAEAEGIDGTAVTHATVITVSAADVEARRGQGWAPGIMAGILMPMIEQAACTDASACRWSARRARPCS